MTARLIGVMAGLVLLSPTLTPPVYANEYLDNYLDRELFAFEFETLFMGDFTYTERAYRKADDASFLEPRRSELKFNVAYGKRLSFNLDLKYDADDQRLAVKNAYLEVDLPNKFSVQLGKQKQLFGISRTSSSRNLLTIERPLSTDLLQLDRTEGVLIKKSFNNSLLQTGYFQREDDAGFSIDSGIIKALYEFDLGGDQYWHLGTSLAREDYNGAEYRIKSKGSADAIDNFLESQKLTVDKVHYWGLDSAYIRDRLTLLGEYLENDVSVNGGDDLGYKGGYIQSSWFLSDDSHRFRDGKIRAVNPKGNYALELISTYSFLDTRDGLEGFDIETLSAGINYYYSENIKLMAEYNYSRISYGEQASENGTAVLLRLQLNF